MTSNPLQNPTNTFKLPLPYNMLNFQMIPQLNAFQPLPSPTQQYIRLSTEELKMMQRGQSQINENVNCSITKLCAKRPKKVLDIEIISEKKALRAEKNRIFAKESRDRKRLYVKNLEQQVDFLRSELERYKRQLSKYEFIERHNKAEYEYLEAINFLSSRNAKFCSEQEFVEASKTSYDKITKERQETLAKMTHLMLEMFMPFTAKLLLYTIENGVDIHNSHDIVEFIHKKLPLEHTENLSDYVKKMHLDLKDKTIDYIANSGARINESVKEIVKCQKKVQAEIFNIGNLIKENALSKITLKDLNAYTRLTPQLLSIPELRSYSFHKLRDTDLMFAD